MSSPTPASDLGTATQTLLPNVPDMIENPQLDAKLKLTIKVELIRVIAYCFFSFTFLVASVRTRNNATLSVVRWDRITTDLV